VFDAAPSYQCCALSVQMPLGVMSKESSPPEQAFDQCQPLQKGTDLSTK